MQRYSCDATTFSITTFTITTFSITTSSIATFRIKTLTVTILKCGTQYMTLDICAEGRNAGYSYAERHYAERYLCKMS